jgi:hypothetical protein
MKITHETTIYAPGATGRLRYRVTWFGLGREVLQIEIQDGDDTTWRRAREGDFSPAEDDGTFSRPVRRR